jgi:hypothetical protein
MIARLKIGELKNLVFPLGARSELWGASHFCNEYKYSNAKSSFFRYQSETNLASESQFENPVFAKSPDM